MPRLAGELLAGRDEIDRDTPATAAQGRCHDRGQPDRAAAEHDQDAARLRAQHVHHRIGTGLDSAAQWCQQVEESIGVGEGLNVGLSYWLLFGLFQGISHGQVENQDRRMFNQGIQCSFRDSGLIGIVSGGAILITDILNIGVSIDETALGPNTFGLRIDLSVGPSVAISFGQLSGRNHSEAAAHHEKMLPGR